jgi:hypothetical protein
VDKLTRNLLILLLMLCMGATTYAQGGRPPILKGAGPGRIRRPNVAKRFEAIKKAYISQQLSLSTEQGSKFWPMYDEYQDELEEVAILRKANNAAAPANQTDQFDRELSYQARITSIQKHYYDMFCKVLPPEKAGMVFKSERDFKFELLRRLKEGKIPMSNN